MILGFEVCFCCWKRGCLGALVRIFLEVTSDAISIESEFRIPDI